MIILIAFFCNDSLRYLFTKVEITFRMAWRRSFSGYTYCDRSTIDQGSLVANLGSVVCFKCQPGYWLASDINMGDTSFVCTDFSEQEDWTQGERTFTFHFNNKVAEFG